MKKIFIAALLTLGVVAAPLSAFAYIPYEWASWCANEAGTAIEDHGLGIASTTLFLVPGNSAEGPCHTMWYEFNTKPTNGGFRVDPTTSGGIFRNKISIDLGAWSPLDIGNLGDLLDAKVSTATYNNGIGGAMSSSTFNTFFSNTNSTVTALTNNFSGASSTLLASAATSSGAGLMTKVQSDKLASIQATRQQTNASGVLTWTFPTAFATGTVPVITSTVEASSTDQFSLVITSVTNTSASVRVTSMTSVTLLSTLLGTAPEGTQAYVHLTAIAP